MLDQAVCVFFHTEEIRVLLCLVDRVAAYRTFALFLNLGRGIECLALLAVHSAVVAKIDIALVVELFEDLLDLALMIGVGRADKAVVGCAHQVPETLDLGCDFVDKFLGALACAGRPGLDLLSVLVGTCHEADIVTVRPFIAGNAVRQDDLIAVADMRLAGRIGDCSCDIIFSFILHGGFPPIYTFPYQHRTSAPFSVTRTWISHCAEGLPSWV